MKAIIAQNRAGYIGLNNALPFHCKADLQHFARLTFGQKLLVGYRTAQSLPPLKNRQICIDPRGELHPNLAEIDWCIGGRATYEKYKHLFTELHISHIDFDDTVGDTFAPNWSGLNASCVVYNYFFI